MYLLTNDERRVKRCPSVARRSSAQRYDLYAQKKHVSRLDGSKRDANDLPTRVPRGAVLSFAGAQSFAKDCMGFAAREKAHN